MNIFKKKNIINFTVIGEGLIKLEYDNGTYSIHSNTVWSVNKDPNNELGEDQTSGMVHLFQDGAGGSIGYFGHWISLETPLIVNGDPMTDCLDVENYLLNNLYGQAT